MAPRISVRTEPYYDAAQLLTHDILGPPLGGAERLSVELNACGNAMAGSDPGAKAWVEVYGPSAYGAFTATSDLLNATFRVGLLLDQTGRNHERAEAASTPGVVVPDPWTFAPDWQAYLELPPPAYGGSTAPPSGWHLVEHWVGYLWPDGDPGRLRHAARAWHVSARTMIDAAERFWRPYQLIEALESPEVSDALVVLEGLRQHYSDLAHVHDALGDACAGLAAHIEKVHSEIEDAVVELVEWTIGLEVAGGLLSVVTAGLSEAAANAEVYARCVVVAERIKTIYTTFRVAVAAWIDALPTLTELAERVSLALGPIFDARLAYAGVNDVRTTRVIVMEARAQRRLEQAAETVKAERVASTVTKSNSPMWRSFKPLRGEVKTNGLRGKDRRLYTWDHLHNDIEVFEGGGTHLSSMDPVTGAMTKPAVAGRTIKK